jgi:flagellar motility protein MotE (MotC chaperone)
MADIKEIHKKMNDLIKSLENENIKYDNKTVKKVIEILKKMNADDIDANKYTELSKEYSEFIKKEVDT